MINPVSVFSFISLRILVIDCWYFFLSVQLLFSPSCFFLFVSAPAFPITFPKCVIKLILSSCYKNRALKAHRSFVLVSGALGLWSLGRSNWVAALRNHWRQSLHVFPPGLLTFPKKTLPVSCLEDYVHVGACVLRRKPVGLAFSVLSV